MATIHKGTFNEVLVHSLAVAQAVSTQGPTHHDDGCVCDTVMAFDDKVSMAKTVSGWPMYHMYHADATSNTL